ncbi:myelomonocytic growth factor-like [Latimeria chalumnae]|uniref:myelomonocytic growth factor-like n=1 Tax=Latimeria chalumnae TaxID=7897 RepID=UPI00313BBE3A
MNKMEAGLQVYGDYLNLIKKVIVGSSLAETVQADIMDLQQHIRQKIAVWEIPFAQHVGMHPQYTLPNFAASFDEQAGGHIVLSHFKRFMETVLRVLQYMKD